MSFLERILIERCFVLSVGVVVKAKNEEDNIGITLKYLFRQTLKPSIVVVVNDGSKDRTGEIARKMGAKVIDLPDIGVYAVSLPHLAYVINVGLREIYRNVDVDYVMIMDADHILPRNYLETIVNRMQKDPRLVMASGVIIGEKTKDWSPRGSGRVVDWSWWKSIGGRYPYHYGWETWLVFRALKDGYKVRAFSDIKTIALRPTKLTPKKYFRYALGMRALGYWFPYVFGRAFMATLKNPLNFYAILAGYLVPVKRYKDLDDFVTRLNREFVKRIVNKIL